MSVTSTRDFPGATGRSLRRARDRRNASPASNPLIFETFEARLLLDGIPPVTSASQGSTRGARKITG